MKCTSYKKCKLYSNKKSNSKSLTECPDICRIIHTKNLLLREKGIHKLSNITAPYVRA